MIDEGLQMHPPNAEIEDDSAEVAMKGTWARSEAIQGDGFVTVYRPGSVVADREKGRFLSFAFCLDLCKVWS